MEGPAEGSIEGLAEGSSEEQESAEVEMVSKLPVPGKGREGMPATPQLTEEERGVERTELHHFSRFGPQHVDASMQRLAALAKLTVAELYEAPARRFRSDLNTIS